MNTPSVSTSQEEKQIFTLEAESELRLEIPPAPTLSSITPNTICTIRLTSGTAELFGAELGLDKDYILSGSSKVAIFTWHGCVIEVSGKCDISYVSKENSANLAYVSTHAQLEALREEVLYGVNDNSYGQQESSSTGPRVLITGISDCGKTALARVLLAYAVKVGRKPILADIDVTQNLLSIPGTISALPISSYDSISVPSYASNTILQTSSSSPFVLWYGSTDLVSNPDLYKAQLVKLGNVINTRIDNSNDAGVKSSGVIVNMSGYGIEAESGYNLLLHAIDSLNINIVLVLGHDRLYSMLTTHYSSDNLKIVKLPRSGGVVTRDTNIRRLLRIQSLKKYFYGEMLRKPPVSLSDTATFVHQYSPVLLEVSLNNLKLFKLSSVSLTASMLPVSAKQTTDPVQLLPIEITMQLKHAILAVCHSNAVEMYEKSDKASDLYLSGIAGFVAVEKIDLDRGIVSLLSPCSGSLPSNTLLVGDITWME